jgi:predicted ATPase
MLHQLRGEPTRVFELAGEMQTLAVERGLPYRQATAGVLLGWARSAIGEPTAGCGDLEVALARYRQTGAASELPYFLILYADAARMAGFSQVGQRALDEASTLATFRPSCIGAEIERVGAALLLQSGAEPAVAEKRLRTALAAARNRGALALELRAAADLRRLELADGRSGDAITILRSALGRFTEGHDTPDIRDGQELLR